MPPDGLDRAERALLADQAHHEHRRRGDDVALGETLEDGQQLHPVPEPVIAEEDEFGLGRILEVAAMHDDRGADREQEDAAGDDLIGGVAVAAEPAALRRCLR